MGDLIVVALVAGLMFFMMRRGGCCGGHSHETHQQGEKSQGCCNVDDKDVKDQN